MSVSISMMGLGVSGVSLRGVTAAWSGVVKGLENGSKATGGAGRGVWGGVVGDGRMMQSTKLGHSRASRTTRAGRPGAPTHREKVNRAPRFPALSTVVLGPGVDPVLGALTCRTCSW